jgi:hypothetical protein
MIKLKAVESKGDYRLLLRFSDGIAGVFDFTPFIEAATEMTVPLRDPRFFSQYFIEFGALAWPNGVRSECGVVASTIGRCGGVAS